MVKICKLLFREELMKSAGKNQPDFLPIHVETESGIEIVVAILGAEAVNFNYHAGDTLLMHMEQLNHFSKGISLGCRKLCCIAHDYSRFNS